MIETTNLFYFILGNKPSQLVSKYPSEISWDLMSLLQATIKWTKLVEYTEKQQRIAPFK